MSHIIDSVVADLATDFAILHARQEGADWDAGNLTPFAATSPGFVGMQAGTKYAYLHVVIERWDGPPFADLAWEDSDELPFEEDPTAGILKIAGFDDTDIGLDVSGLGTARVQVFARGRHRYPYDAVVDPESPEEWLLRFYPVSGEHQPLSGPPRRSAGPNPTQSTVVTPWRGAVLALRSSGWSDVLVSSHGFYLAQLALLMTHGPVTRQQLAAQMARYMAPWELGGADAEHLPVPPRGLFGDQADPLTSYGGGHPIGVIGDAIDALLDIGLLLRETRQGKELLIANPAPEPAWERLGMEGSVVVGLRSRALAEQHNGAASDIKSAVAWTRHDGLTTTARAMALRWSTTVDDIVGGLRIITGTGDVVANRELGFDADIDADETLRLWSAGAR